MFSFSATLHRAATTTASVVALASLIIAGHLAAQNSQAASSAMAFDVASVRKSLSGDPPSSRFPLGSGDAYLPGGVFSARNQPLIAYLRFAYKVAELDGVPGWVNRDVFDIEARATSTASKDDLRQMTRVLLAERFNLRVVSERRERPALALSLAGQGRLGPSLMKDADASCTSTTIRALLDVPCGSMGPIPTDAAAHVRLAGRGVTLDQLAAYMVNPVTGIERPVVNRTGVTTPVDFALEWVPGELDATASPASGETFLQALRDQLGMILKPTRALVDTLRVAHIEPLSEP
jgi:uncharacterized protein (TIGR03435 family)